MRGGRAAPDPSSMRPLPWQMAKIYSSVPGYEGVKILRIVPAASSRQGARVRRAGGASASSPVGTGLNVDHEVIFRTTASPNLTEEFQNKTQELVQKLQETAESQGDCENDSCGCPVLTPRHPTPRGGSRKGSLTASLSPQPSSASRCHPVPSSRT